MFRLSSPVRLINLISLALIFLAAPAVATAQDINGDGRVDAVFTQKQRYNQVCVGNGTGAFTTCTDIIGAGANQISNQINTTDSALVDWDADGDLDIVFAMEGHANVVCFNAGGGNFNAGAGCQPLFDYNSFPYNSQSVAVGDLDNDGLVDLVFANGGNPGLPLDQPNVMCMGLGTGQAACYEVASTAAASTGVALGDVDGDGDLDILTSNTGGLNHACLNQGETSPVLVGVPVFDCRAIPQAGTVSATKASNAVAVGNLPAGWGATPDQHLDVVFGNTGQNEFCFGNGDWSGSGVGLTCTGFNAATGYGTSGVIVSDSSAQTVGVVIADVVPSIAGVEVLFANADAPNVRCLGTYVSCGFSFNETQTVTADFGGAVNGHIVEATMGLAVRDIDIDGKLDVVVANTGVAGGVSRMYPGTQAASVVARSGLYPTSVTLSGGDVGPSLVDEDPPVFSGANNLTREATGPDGAVVQFAVTALDVVDGPVAVTCAPASGSVFPLGNTTVSCTAEDEAGNVATAPFVVTVADTTGPAVLVPSDFTVNGTPGQSTAAVTFTVSALDAVDGAREVVCFDTATAAHVPSGAQLGGGVYTLECGAYDTRSNYGASTFTVTVVVDTDGDGITDPADLDDDNDGIADTVDAESLVASSTYRFDSVNTGAITRNGWTVAVTPPPAGSSYSMRASISGTGNAPAVVKAYCGGVFKELRLNTAGDTIDWRCDQNPVTSGRSLSVLVVSGTPEFWKAGFGGWAKVTTSAGNGVTAGSPVSAPASNTAPVLVTLLDEFLVEIGSFSLDPEEVVDVNFVEGPDGEPVLQLEVLNGGADGIVSVTLFGETVTLTLGDPPASFDVNPDLTAPVITATIIGTLGANGYYTSDVTVTWTVTDDESAATPAGCETQSVTTDTHGVTFTCAAQSEGGTSTQTVTIKRDATAPVVTVPADISVDATGASGAVVAYTTSVQDNLDTTPTLACAPASGSTFPVGSTTVTCTATDAAGNTAAGTFGVTVVGQPAGTAGQMRGSGFIRSGGKRYDIQLDVRESANGERGRLRLDVSDESGRGRGRGDSFESTSIASVAFSDDPAYRPGSSKTVHVDSVLFTGTGTWNGQAGYAFEAFAEDRGEPGRHRESVRVTIRNASGAVVAFVEGELSGGNIQSLRIKH